LRNRKKRKERKRKKYLLRRQTPGRMFMSKRKRAE
jgi:hypothetical protein